MRALCNELPVAEHMSLEQGESRPYMDTTHSLGPNVPWSRKIFYAQFCVLTGAITLVPGRYVAQGQETLILETGRWSLGALITAPRSRKLGPRAGVDNRTHLTLSGVAEAKVDRFKIQLWLLDTSRKTRPRPGRRRYIFPHPLKRF